MEFKLQSDEIDKLTVAFVQARSEFKFVKEDAKANFGTYVSIGEIKAATHDSLLKHGLSLTQDRTIYTAPDNNLHQILVTKLTHTSGQWKASYVPLFLPESMPKGIDQSIGTALSYQKRYELYGLFSVMGEDLDPDSINNDPKLMPTNGNGFISEKQLLLLKSLLKGQESRETGICARYKIDSLDKLPWKYMDEVVTILKQKIQ